MNEIKIKEFLSDPNVEHCLKQNDLDSVYMYWNDFNSKFESASEISDLTRFLMDIGIDPLKYFSYKIGDYCFASTVKTKASDPWNKINDLNINALHIGRFAFMGNRFENLILGPEVLTIDSCAFNWCNKLKKVVIQSSKLTRILERAFNCTAITEITLPDSIIYISNNAFDLEAVVYVPSTAGIDWGAHFEFKIVKI